MKKSHTTLLIFILILIPLILVQAQSRGAGVRTKNSAQTKRIALVIGNGNYQHTSKLDNPVNDAVDMTSTLKTLGFEVISGTDQSKRQMQNLIRKFGNRLADTKGVGLFFYAGHGVATGGVNYLIPVDADIQAEDEIDNFSISLEFLLGKMASAKNGFNMIILDACRNNPFARSWRNYRDLGDRGGLARVNAPTGTLIAYATKPGDVASDGDGRNGLYTSALLKQMRVKNVDVTKMLQNVRADVLKKSNNKQVPFDESSLVGDFYFAGKNGEEIPIKKSTEPTPVELDENAGERAVWNQIRNSTERRDFELFLRTFPDGIYASQARLRYEQVWWESISNSTGKSDFEEFIKKFPTGQYKVAAEFAVKRLKQVVPKTGMIRKNRLGMSFSYIPPGTFQMGSTKGDAYQKVSSLPVHTVRISKGFWMGTYEVTQEEWEKVMGNNPSNFKNCRKCPVQGVSWNKVQDYIRKLNSQMNDGSRYRLPTEAEWEYAARAGTTGDYAGNLDKISWYKSNSGSKTHPVGKKSANVWGLYDMYGNVWEWVEDWFGPYPSGSVTNPTGATSGSSRVIRGGSWDNTAPDLQSGIRHAFPPGPGSPYIGFRLVMTLNQN